MKNMNKAIYVSPEMQVALIEAEDIITASTLKAGGSGDSMSTPWIYI